MNVVETANLEILALPTSPYAARLHVQLLEKGLQQGVDWRFVYPAAGTSRAGHSVLNPFLRTPILVNGPDCLIESSAIAEYLEDLHPTPSLRGATPWATAQVRAFIAALDHDLFPQLLRLRSLSAGDATAAEVVTATHQVLERLARLCGKAGYVCDNRFTLADCALLPACFYLELFLRRLGQADLYLEHERWAEWQSVVGQHASVQAVLAHLRAALPPAA